MTDLNPIPERAARLRAYIADDRLIRRDWTRKDEQGRHLACLLAALSPEAGEAKSSSACPGDVMPQWLAQLLPAIDDMGSDGAWPSMIRRLAATVEDWHRVSPAGWERIRTAHLLVCLEIARESVTVDEWGVLPALDEVARLLREGGTRKEWAAATRAAKAAAWAAAARAAWAARAAAWAAFWAAFWAAGAAGAATGAAAWDRVTDTLLTAIEQEIKVLEAADAN